MRVAFFPMHPEDDRATETFAVLPVDRGGPYGIQGAVFLPSSARTHHAFYRRKSRGWRLRALVYWYGVVLPRRLAQLVTARRFDLIFVQRSMFRWKSPPVLEWAAARILRKPVVYHLDDGIWLEARRGWSELRCRLATRVVTGNDLIASFARDAGTEVEEIEYAVDAGAYPVREHRPGEAVIGYVGFYPEEHLLPIAEALLETCRSDGARVRVVGGARRPRLGPGLDTFLDWQPWDSRDAAANMGGIDIGIMPLADTELHRAKEPLKIKEYMAAGLPIVASPVGHNLRVVTEGEEGFFATTPDEWRARLGELARDHELRRSMGRRGRELVLRRYDLPRLLEELAELFDRLGPAEAVRPAEPKPRARAGR